MNNTSSSLDFHISPKAIRLFYTSVIVVDTLLLSTYAVLRYGLETNPPWILILLRNQLNLSAENVSAVWYSAIILLLISIAAVVCFHIHLHSGPKTKSMNILRYGWPIIAIIFAGFSFDEMGSLHERLDKILPNVIFTYTGGSTNWVIVLLPIMVVIFFYFLLFFFLYFSQSRVSQLLALLGAGALMVVPVMEFLFAKKGGHIYSLLEEALEILGMTLILVAFLEFAIKISRLKSLNKSDALGTETNDSIRINLDNRIINSVYLVNLLLAMASLLLAWFFVPHLDDLDKRGNPSVWYPAVALFIAAVVALFNFSLYYRDTAGPKFYSFSSLWLLMAGLALSLSVDFEADLVTLALSHLAKFLSAAFAVSLQGINIILSLTVILASLGVSCTVSGVKENRSSRLLFLLGSVLWAGVFVVPSWSAREALKIFSPSLFLMSFIESIKYLSRAESEFAYRGVTSTSAHEQEAVVTGKA